jgi:hypothetical protein
MLACIKLKCIAILVEQLYIFLHQNHPEVVNMICGSSRLRYAAHVDYAKDSEKQVSCRPAKIIYVVPQFRQIHF